MDEEDAVGLTDEDLADCRMTGDGSVTEIAGVAADRVLASAAATIAPSKTIRFLRTMESA
jgi:hypothetical protein